MLFFIRVTMVIVSLHSDKNTNSDIKKTNILDK